MAILEVLSGTIIILIAVVIAVRYCYQTVRGEIVPVLATWILFCVATLLSLATYLSSSASRTLWSNVFATSDTGGVLLILLTILFAGKQVRRGFNRLEIGCLAATAAIAVAWSVSRSHVACNLLVQLILLIAYFPLVRHLWISRRPTEPAFTWSLQLGSCCIALVGVLANRDWLAVLYIGRAIVSISVVLLLLLRIRLLYGVPAPPGGDSKPINESIRPASSPAPR